MGKRILLVDDEEQLCISLSRLLEARDYGAIYTTDPEKALEILEAEEVDLVITDLKMPELSGTDLIKKIRRRRKELPIIMVSGYASVDNVVKAMQYGAANFFEKPVRFADLIREISNLLSCTPCSPEGSGAAAGSTAHALLTSANALMQGKIDLLRKAAPTDAPVLLTGESGTGKELAAGTLHHFSERKHGPFIKINCAAIPEALLESELFGFEKGAFTDATAARQGKFEIAEGGTIFLDEIGEMSITTQAKLLRVLQEKEFQRLGSHKVRQMNVRIIAATNKNLQKQIAGGSFREDLYYRLSVIQIELPPLRERKEDILFLARKFLHEFNMKYRKNIEGLSGETELLFLQHDWPGNVRELRNSMERMIIFCEHDYLDPDLLPDQYRKYPATQNKIPLKSVSESISREVILDALEKTGKSRSRAAELLGITRKTLYNKMKKLDIRL
jgi:DNA-binding NtrC family response regulator